jgi:hypothetical protein
MLEPARSRISTLAQDSDTVNKQFQAYLNWLSLVTTMLRTDAALPAGIQGVSNDAYTEFSTFSGIHYQCDLSAGCHDVLGAAAEVDATKPENLARSLADTFHDQPEPIRTQAAAYISRFYAIVPQQ